MIYHFRNTNISNILHLVRLILEIKEILVRIYSAIERELVRVIEAGKFFGMKLSGHKKYDTFKKYVRLSLDEYADDIAKNADNCLF